MRSNSKSRPNRKPRPTNVKDFGQHKVENQNEQNRISSSGCATVCNDPKRRSMIKPPRIRSRLRSSRTTHKTAVGELSPLADRDARHQPALQTSAQTQGALLRTGAVDIKTGSVLPFTYSSIFALRITHYFLIVSIDMCFLSRGDL